MRVVVDILSGEVPRAVGDGPPVVIGARPHLDVDAVSDLIVGRSRRLVSVAHQRSQQTNDVTNIHIQIMHFYFTTVFFAMAAALHSWIL